MMIMSSICFSLSNRCFLTWKYMYIFKKKTWQFFLSARFSDADVCVVLCLQCIRDSVIIVEEPSESASKYRSSCAEQPFLSLSYRNACLSSSITTTRSRHTCNAQRVVNGMDIWYTGMHWICHNIALADIYLANSRTSAQQKNYREINFHLAK